MQGRPESDDAFGDKAVCAFPVHGVAPGLIETPWTEGWDKMHQSVVERAAARRAGAPEEVAVAVESLASNCSITGAILVVDAGLTQVL